MVEAWDTWPKTGALLLSGELENTFALACSYASALLCASNVHAKALWEAKTHPDFKAVLAEDNKSTRPVIKIDQLRDLITWSTGRPQIGLQKVAIIYPAEAMNVQAANALLKTLEEPTEDTLIILVCEQAAFLAETLRSRCFKVRCKNEKKEIERSALPVGMIEEVQSIVEGKSDPSAIAERWIKQGSAKEWVSRLWILSAMQIRANAEKGILINQNLNQQLLEAGRQLEEFPASNAQLVLENILFAHVGLKVNYVY